MNSERYTMRAAVYVVMERDNEVLFIRRNNTGYRDGEYTLPAGHVEPNETFIETGVREAREETHADIRPQDLALLHVMQRHEKGVNVVDYYFGASSWKNEPTIGEPHKADALKWVPMNDIEDNPEIIHYVREALQHIAHNEPYSSNGLDGAVE